MKEHRIEFLQTLRALAFIFVFLYHIYPAEYSGGFLGVNLFFLISGFIITKIFYSKENININSILFFLRKRFLKLFPYLLSTIFLTIVFGYFFLGKKLFYETFQSSLYSISFISNFFYYNEFSYFDFYAKSNPLLHTWSLSIEIQFYLIFSLVLLLFKKYFKNFLFFLVLFIISFSLSLIFYNSVNALFYLPFFRFYEFILGSLAFLISKKFKLDIFNLTFTSLGLIIIFLYIFYYNPSNNLSLVNSIILFIGFLLVVVSNNKKIENIFKKIKIVNFFGDESYLFYLIHWPIIVIYKSYINSSILNYLDTAFIFSIMITMQLGIKKTIIHISNLDKSNIVVILFILFSLPLFLFNGMKITERKLSDDYYTSAITQENNLDKKILIVGDSHAKHLFYGVKLINKNTKLFEKDFVGNFNFYSDLNLEIDKFKPEYIIYSMKWDHQRKLNKIKSEWYAIFDNEVFNFYQDEIDKLSINIDKKINLIIVGSLPMINYFNSPEDCLTRKIKFKKNDCSFSKVNSSINMVNRKAFNKFLKTNENKLSHKVVDPFEIFCSINQCLNIKDQKFIYFDDNHLTRYGSQIFAQNFFLNYMNSK